MRRLPPLLTASNARWTAAQEKAVARDFPFVDLDSESPDQFVVRTYLQFLWLPQSIMPIDLLVPSVHRVQNASPSSAPHSLHALLDPLLLSVRSAVAKYHAELPQILAHDGGEGGPEESMMWYALAYEPNEGGASDDDLQKAWLERLERRERVVQIQILLHLLKLSLPGPCTPLPSVTVPVNDATPWTRRKRRKEREKVVTPTVQERLESFMDKLAIWQLLNKDEDKRDWTRSFCENVVERQFKSTLPDMCKLLRDKLFPRSPFEDNDEEDDARPSPPDPVRKLARSSTSRSLSQSDKKSVQRSSSVSSDARSRSRSLSVSLAQDASERRSNSVSATTSTLKRALSREVSMSRGFKPRVQPSAKGVQTKPKADARKEQKSSQGVTLVAATPTKPKVREWTDRRRSRVPSLVLEDYEVEVPGEADSDELPCQEEDEELWLPNSSPDILHLGTNKRTASGSSSSVGETVETPVKKRLRVR